MPYLYKHRRPPEPWPEFRHKARHPILLPFFALEFTFEWISYGLSQWRFLEVLEYAGSFSILIAVIFYFAESGARTEARHYQAWQVINTAQGKGGNGGRIEALTSLHEDGVPLVGIDVSDAYLQDIKLEKANLLRADLRRADLRGAHLAGANLELANLHYTNFRDADLRGVNLTDVNLQEADLSSADLSGADLSGAVLDRADLRNSDLSGITNWQKQVSVKETDIRGVRHAPDGFVDWATRQGAIATDASASESSPQTSATTRP